MEQMGLMEAARRADPLGAGAARAAGREILGEARGATAPRPEKMAPAPREPGAEPLRNGKWERFCAVLTGWGGDGLRKRNCEAYEIVYGRGGATARTQSSVLLARPEVRERAAWMERRVAEAARHDHLAAQREIDELRLGIVARGKSNSKLAALALQAARDFENAHGLAAPVAARAEELRVEAAGADGLATVRAVLTRAEARRSDTGNRDAG